MPSVVLGRNDRIAWGFTNTGPDVQDLYVEKIDPEDWDKYLTPTGSEAFRTRTEVISIKDAAPVELVVRATRHGPVISDVLGRRSGVPAAKTVLAMAWTALRDDDRTLEAGLQMMRAAGWDDFVAALRGFHVPQQNIVYADVDGNIGFYAPALVPIRKPENAAMGMMPVPGWEAGNDWAGWIPFDELPHAFNPATGVVATANNKIVPDSYRYHITNEWEQPYRATRITELLAEREIHSVASFKAMQADVGSVMARELLPLLVQTEATSTVAAIALRRLAAWDGTMAGERVEPTIFVAWMRELNRLLFADELRELFDQFWAYRPIFVANVLSNRQGQGRWCDNVDTAAVESCPTILAQSLERALADLEQRYGGDGDEWRWDRVHVALSEHRPFSKLPLLRRLFELQVPFPGGQFTINRAGNRLASARDPFATVHGPSMRAIYDLGQPDRSVFIHSTGQSGNPLSPLYANFTDLWAGVDYVPMTMRRADIARDALGTLVLKPGS